MSDAERLIAAWRREYGQSFAAVESAIRADEQVNALEFCCADTEPDLRRKIAAEVRTVSSFDIDCPEPLNPPCVGCVTAHIASRIEQGGAS